LHINPLQKSNSTAEQNYGKGSTLVSEDWKENQACGDKKKK